MTAEQLAQLREVAERAAWGNWQAYKPHKGARGYEVKNGVEAVAQHCLKHDACFIASANPKTVLALLDELEWKEKRIAELESNQTTETGQQIIIEAIGAHGYIVGCLLQGRQDLALEESRKWVEAFGLAALTVEE
ncbi:ead/Ea22-like family protein [Atlantibacter hermannii]|uniref:ead/Ea22-like family protein n=1 Tax=Atlantibacter hermannii TaxID=565 RepID=UPI00254F5B9C|nr:ead/Ea22-like family protein [Atlantibacter hermannii]